jgi:hypothetical protein
VGCKRIYVEILSDVFYHHLRSLSDSVKDEITERQKGKILGECVQRQCIYGFCMILRVNSNYFLTPNDLCTGEALCFT